MNAENKKTNGHHHTLYIDPEKFIKEIGTLAFVGYYSLHMWHLNTINSLSANSWEWEISCDDIAPLENWLRSAYEHLPAWAKENFVAVLA